MESLPNELIAKIVSDSCLTVRDMKRLRCSCKLLSAFATERLAKEHFSHFNLLLNTENLERLSYICTHAQLGRYVYSAKIWRPRNDDSKGGRNVKLGPACSSIREIELDPDLWEYTEELLPSVTKILRLATKLRSFNVVQQVGSPRYSDSARPRYSGPVRLPNFYSYQAATLGYLMFHGGDKNLHSIVSDQMRKLHLKHVAISSGAALRILRQNCTTLIDLVFHDCLLLGRWTKVLRYVREEMSITSMSLYNLTETDRLSSLTLQYHPRYFMGSKERSIMKVAGRTEVVAELDRLIT